MTLEEKIFHYYNTKCNIYFRGLCNTIQAVCECVKPVYPDIEPSKYFEYFFKEIDFDKIEDKNQNRKFCSTIYVGLEHLLKADVNKAILNYQNNVSNLSKEQIQETQIKLIELIGKFKRQARTNKPGISFTQRFLEIHKTIVSKEKLSFIDYQLIIAHFNETILNDLLSSFEIINDTFKEITPLLKALPPQPIDKQNHERETPKTFDELFYNTDLVTPCIDILKELDPPLIDTDCNYIGKLKGVFCVWIDEMQRQGIVKSNYPEERKLFASLIPQKIKRFSIDESMFGKYQSKAEKNYRTDIKTKVSEIKLSQNYHKGKQGNLSL